MEEDSRVNRLTHVSWKNDRSVQVYRKTLYFRCILISLFSYVENLLHFNFAHFPVKLLCAYKVMVMGKFQKFACV